MQFDHVNKRFILMNNTSVAEIFLIVEIAKLHPEYDEEMILSDLQEKLRKLGK
jgi:hypothetical protein